MPAQRSIVICGGAFAGLALALALRQGLGPDIPVVVADPALGQRPSRDPRATAIVAACRRLFEAQSLKECVAPLEAVVEVYERLGKPPRLVLDLRYLLLVAGSVLGYLAISRGVIIEPPAVIAQFINTVIARLGQRTNAAMGQAP